MNENNSRSPISYLLDEDFIGEHVNMYAENLSFTFDVGNEPDVENMWVAKNGQIYIYMPCSFADGRPRWGKLYLRNGSEVFMAYDAVFDEKSEFYNEKVVNMQRIKYGLDLLPTNIVDVMYNRERNVNGALAGNPV